MTTAEWDAELARHGRVGFSIRRRRLWRLVAGSGLFVAISPIVIADSPVGGTLCLVFFGLCLAIFLRALAVGTPLVVTTTGLEVRDLWGRSRTFARSAVIDIAPGLPPRHRFFFVRLADGTPRRPLPALLDADPEELAAWLNRWAVAGRTAGGASG